MAKGQKRSNKEVRKPKSTVPKKSAEISSGVTSAFARPAKGFVKPKAK
jgi:hypothetical protein